MIQICESCGAEFASTVVINGQRLDLRGRKRCLACYPHHPQRKPRRSVSRPRATRICDGCGKPFALRQVIDGKLRHLYRRRFCLDCSPFGAHNTSKQPVGQGPDAAARRKRRRTDSQVRYGKKRRQSRKLMLVQAKGGRCEDCGYAGAIAALEFHHRDPSAKEFGVGGFNGSQQRLLAEVAKCELLCANCHRLRHAALDFGRALHAVVEHRRRRKERAVMYMGGTCEGCGRHGHPAIFEFHHLDAREKDFGLSESGIPHTWERALAELRKCVMLCANCHREVHAGVREIDDGPLGLAERSGAYVA